MELDRKRTRDFRCLQLVQAIVILFLFAGLASVVWVGGRSRSEARAACRFADSAECIVADRVSRCVAGSVPTPGLEFDLRRAEGTTGVCEVWDGGFKDTGS